VLSGLLNSNAGISKTYLGESCTKEQQPAAFATFCVMYGLGSVIAPAIGGFLRCADMQSFCIWSSRFCSFVFLQLLHCHAESSCALTFTCTNSSGRDMDVIKSRQHAADLLRIQAHHVIA